MAHTATTCANFHRACGSVLGFLFSSWERKWSWSICSVHGLQWFFFYPITCSFGTLEGPHRLSLHRVGPGSLCLRWLAAEWWPCAETAFWLRSPLEWGSFLTAVPCTDKTMSTCQPLWRNYLASSYMCFDILEWEASSSLIISQISKFSRPLYWEPNQFILKNVKNRENSSVSTSLANVQIQSNCSFVYFFPLEKYDRSN